MSFVQPLPEERVLLAAARAKPGAVNAEVWTSSGELRHRGYIGDAIEELLTTPAGKVWAGYFDEAMGGSGPEGHGLARFREDLTAEWLYPLDAGLPYISDCYALNVEGETAYFCPYTGFHILSAAGERVTDWGPSPYRSAHNLLRRGADLAVLTGWGPEYDVATLLRISRDGVREEGGRCRVVLPDGMEARGLRYTCRGDVLHAFVRSTWYSINLDGLSTAASHGRAWPADLHVCLAPPGLPFRSARIRFCRWSRLGSSARGARPTLPRSGWPMSTGLPRERTAVARPTARSDNIVSLSLSVGL